MCRMCVLLPSVYIRTWYVRAAFEEKKNINFLMYFFQTCTETSRSVMHDLYAERLFKSISRGLGQEINLSTNKTSLQQTVPVCRMEKIICDMSKHQQLIKRLILFVPLGGEISLKLTFYRNEHLFAFCSGCVGFGFGFWIFLKRQPL